MTIGQSQGGGASIYTARYTTKLGGRALDYRGAVGTGTPAYVEDIVQNADPKTPSGDAVTGADRLLQLPDGVATVGRAAAWHRQDSDANGKKYLRMAERMCTVEFEEKLEDVGTGDFFTQPLPTLPNFRETRVGYLGMPERGFDKPFFMGRGAQDTDMPYTLTRSQRDFDPVAGRHDPLRTQAVRFGRLRGSVSARLSPWPGRPQISLS